MNDTKVIKNIEANFFIKEFNFIFGITLDSWKTKILKSQLLWVSEMSINSKAIPKYYRFKQQMNIN